jgi:hypothetical protein
VLKVKSQKSFFREGHEGREKSKGKKQFTAVAEITEKISKLPPPKAVALGVLRLEGALLLSLPLVA